MKSLNCLTYIQRARLLHQLFPNVIPFYLEYLKNACEVCLPVPFELLNDSGYTNGGLQKQAQLVLEIFKKEDFHLETRRKAFSETLFLPLTVQLVVDQLVKFALDKEQCYNLKFKMLVEVLFVGQTVQCMEKQLAREND
jgi:hypothetical protein